jgi:uncharacterized membrane protein
MFNIHTFVILYAISVPIFFLIDMIWLGVVAKDFYQSKLSHLMGDVNWIAAVIFYLVFLLGLTFFAMYPAVMKGTLLTAVVLGALFGFFTYATYDLTNLATLRNWPLSLTLVDMLWGTLLGASVSALTVFVYNHFIVG